MALAAAIPTRRPVNRPGPDVDGHAADLVEVDAGLVARKSIDGASDSAWRLGPAGVDLGQHALVPADGATDLLGRGRDAEDQHAGPRARTPRAGRPSFGRLERLDAPPASPGASAHDGPHRWQPGGGRRRPRRT